MDSRTAKDKEKTTKYAALRWELKQQYPGYEVDGGWVGGWMGGWVDGLKTLRRR